MKGCFLLQRNFVHIGHGIATLLKERYGLNEFCAYVGYRRSLEFLRSQTDLAYSNLLLDEDIHKTFRQAKLDLGYLRELEQTVGQPNLWTYLAADRILMFNQGVREYPSDRPTYSHTDLLKILQVTAQAMTAFLDRERPDYCFFPPLGSLGNLLLFHLAKRRGIKTFVAISAAIKNRYVLTKENDYFTGVDALFAGLDENISPASWDQARAFLTEFRNRPHTYHDLALPAKQPMTRRKQFQFLLHPKKFLNTAKLFAESLRLHYSTPDRFDYSYHGPWNYLKDSLQRKARNLRGIADLYDPIDPGEDFAFFPLQFEPEISLLVWAPFFADQRYVIRQVARSLPVGHKLYVKEHPLMVVYRPRSYYEELKKIPNVKLIDPAVTSFDLIPHAKLITTITGAVGWESTFLKKPVITFGNIFYNRLPFIPRCDAIGQLPSLVQELLGKNWRYSENELLKFIAAIFADSVEVNLGYLWEIETDRTKKKEGVRPLANLLAKKLGLISVT